MDTTLRTVIERSFATVEAKDMAGMLSFFADNAIFIDPHYPTPRMVGKLAIAKGVQWGFDGMRKFSFKIVNYFEANDGHCAAVEVETSHILKNGIKLHFPQVFVFEVHEGLIHRLQAYEPYGPSGVAGFILAMTRLKHKLLRLLITV